MRESERRRRRGRGYALALATSLVCSNAARAEPPYQTTVHGKRRKPGPPADDPSGFTTTIPVDDDAAGLELGELLDHVPGLRVRRGGRQQTLSLRAAAPYQSVIFLDGLRLTPPGGGSFDLSLIDPNNLETIEVRRSGGSTRFGSDALGGVLLLKTSRLRMKNKTRAALSYGSFGAFYAGISRAGARGNTRYLASASYRQEDGDFPYVDHNGLSTDTFGRPLLRYNNDTRDGQLLLKIDRLIGARWQIGALSNTNVSLRGAPGATQRPSLKARQRTLDTLLALRARRFDLLRGGDELLLTLESRYAFFDFDQPAAPPVQSRNHRFATAAQAIFKLPLAAGSAFELGAELRGELLRDALFDEDADRPTVALWTLGRMTFAGGRLIVAPGVRLTYTPQYSAAVIPKVGLVLRPLRSSKHRALSALELKGNLGRRYRLPSFYEMYVRLDGFGANPELRPEDALAMDAGLRWHYRRLSLEAAYFRRWLKNTILFAPVTATLIRADNYSAARVDGLEAIASLVPGLCLLLSAAYTLTRTRFSISETAAGAKALQLPGHPVHRLSANAAWAAEHCANKRQPRWARGLKIWAQIVAESEQVLDRFNTQIEESRLLLSAGASYRYAFLRLSAEGQNLLDKRDAVDVVGFPLPPARFTLSLTASF